MGRVKKKTGSRVLRVLSPNQLVMRWALERKFGGKRAKMAAAMGMTPQGVGYWMRPLHSGGRDPEEPSLQKLLEVLGVRSFEALLGPDPAAIYYRGHRYGPEDPVFKQLDANAKAALETAGPLTAEELDL